MNRLAVAALALSAAAAAHAAPIYRCGPGGKTYSQVPCAEGTVLESSDPRSAAQRKEAKRIAELERQRAADLERERVAAESAAKPGAAGIAPKAAPAASAAAPKKDFTAVVPTSTARPKAP
jgi:hypothetical protein